MAKQMNSFGELKILVTFLALIGVCACAGPSKFVGQCTIPAETNIGIRTLAISNFKGEQGEAVRDRLYAKLADAKYFSLVDRNQSNFDLAMGQETALDPRILEQLKEVQADGILTATVYSELQDTKGYDEAQKANGGIERIPYVFRQATLRADFKIFDLRTGKLLAVGSLPESFEQKYGGGIGFGELGKKLGDLLNGKSGGSSALPTPNTTMDGLIEKVASGMSQKFTPTQIACEYALAEDSKNDLIKKGNEFAKRGVLETAKELWEQALAAAPDNPAANHNLGVYYESQNELASLKKAKELYEKSTVLSDETFYIDAVARIETSIKNKEKFIAQQKEKRMKETIAGGAQAN